MGTAFALPCFWSRSTWLTEKRWWRLSSLECLHSSCWNVLEEEISWAGKNLVLTNHSLTHSLTPCSNDTQKVQSLHLSCVFDAFPITPFEILFHKFTISTKKLWNRCTNSLGELICLLNYWVTGVFPMAGMLLGVQSMYSQTTGDTHTPCHQLNPDSEQQPEPFSSPKPTLHSWTKALFRHLQGCLEGGKPQELFLWRLEDRIKRRCKEVKIWVFVDISVLWSQLNSKFQLTMVNWVVSGHRWATGKF